MQKAPKSKVWGILQAKSNYHYILYFAIMGSQEVYDVNKRPRYIFMKNSFISLLDDPLGAFLWVPKNVLHVEDIKSYIHCKIESIGDAKIHKDLEMICSNDSSLIPKYTNQSELILVNFIIYTKFENHKWT